MAAAIVKVLNAWADSDLAQLRATYAELKGQVLPRRAVIVTTLPPLHGDEAARLMEALRQMRAQADYRERTVGASRQPLATRRGEGPRAMRPRGAARS